MAKTKVLSTFTSGQVKYLEQNAGVSNIIISNVTTVNVKASVKVILPGFGNSAHIVKNAVIPVGTSLLVLNNQLIQIQSSKIEVETDTTSGIEVVYVAL